MSKMNMNTTPNTSNRSKKNTSKLVNKSFYKQGGDSSMNYAAAAAATPQNKGAKKLVRSPKWGIYFGRKDGGEANASKGAVSPPPADDSNANRPWQDRLRRSPKKKRNEDFEYFK